MNMPRSAARKHEQFEGMHRHQPDDSHSAKWLDVLLLLVSLAVTFLLVEAGLRIWLDSQHQGSLPHFGISEDLQNHLTLMKLHQQRDKCGTTSYPGTFDIYDSLLGWRVKANANVRHVKPNVYEVGIRTNRFGLRGIYPTSLMKPVNTVRLGVFGDSQTFAETVNDDETYISILNRELHNEEVLNFGVRGYGTDQMLLYFKQDAAQYDLDIVMLATAFFHIKRNATGNYFHPKPYYTLLGNDELQLNGTPVPTLAEFAARIDSSDTWELADNSVFLRWFWQRVRNLRERWLFSENGDAWHLTKALITRFVQHAKESGTIVMLMNIDEKHPELEGDLQILADHLTVKLLNLGPVLRKEAAVGTDYTLPDDNHWNATGHMIVAKQLHQFLCEQALVQNCDAKGALP
ncbi:MAG: hypothetical protein ABFS45_26805 [Pseudomonadota bacterium]